MSTARGSVPTDATPMGVCYYEDAERTGAGHERRRVLPPARGNGARNAKGSLLRLKPVLLMRRVSREGTSRYEAIQ